MLIRLVVLGRDSADEFFESSFSVMVTTTCVLLGCEVLLMTEFRHDDGPPVTEHDSRRRVEQIVLRNFWHSTRDGDFRFVIF